MMSVLFGDDNVRILTQSACTARAASHVYISQTHPAEHVGACKISSRYVEIMFEYTASTSEVLDSLPLCGCMWDVLKICIYISKIYNNNSSLWSHTLLVYELVCLYDFNILNLVSWIWVSGVIRHVGAIPRKSATLSRLCKRGKDNPNSCDKTIWWKGSACGTSKSIDGIWTLAGSQLLRPYVPPHHTNDTSETCWCILWSSPTNLLHVIQTDNLGIWFSLWRFCWMMLQQSLIKKWLFLMVFIVV